MNYLRELSVFLVLLGLASGAAAGEGAYKILKKVPVSGDGGWDCLAVDGKARRLYITHDTEVQVFDADSLKLVGKIEGTKRAHGIALVPKQNRGFITSGETGTVVIFDLKTLKRLSEITAQKDADAAVYDPVSGKVFSFNGDSGNATVIEASTGKVLKTLDLGGAPEFAVADGKGRVYDNLEDKNMALMIDAKTLRIVHRWPTAPGESPTGMDMDKKTKRLFIGCRNKRLVVMDATNGKIIQTLPIGEHVDGTTFDPQSGTVFTSNGDGTLTVIREDSPNKYHVVENAKTEPGARTMAYDPQTGHVFSVAAKTLPVAPTPGNPHPWRKIVPGSVHLLVIGQ
jgi:DNA-binding beta-propeller fold protein YncE